MIDSLGGDVKPLALLPSSMNSNFSYQAYHTLSLAKSSGAFVCWHPSSLSIKKTRRTIVLSSAK